MQPPQILLIDDDPGAIQLMGGILTNLGALRFATNGRDGLRLAHEFAPDLILLDAEMPGMSGFELLQELKDDPDLADVPVIFITGHTAAGFEVSALEMGAADFIAKPFRSSLVMARVKIHLRLKRMADELRQAATTDALTGLANRRRFDEVLEREWIRGRRAGSATSLLLIEIDQFKQFKDRYGHQKADDCVNLVAQALLTVCHRPADLFARCGSADFMMLLPETDRGGAEHIAQRAADAAFALGIAHADASGPRLLSLSVGVACHDAASPCAATGHASCCPKILLSAADGALYAVKRAAPPLVTAAAAHV